MGAGSWWAACSPTDEAGRGIFVASLALPRSYRGRGLQMVGSRCCRVLDESRASPGLSLGCGSLSGTTGLALLAPGRRTAKHNQERVSVWDAPGSLRAQHPARTSSGCSRRACCGLMPSTQMATSRTPESLCPGERSFGFRIFCELGTSPPRPSLAARHKGHFFPLCRPRFL